MKHPKESISIRKGKRDWHRILYSRSDWFKTAEYFTIHDNTIDKIVIKKHYYKIPQNAVRISEKGDIFHKNPLPLGVFMIDEETTEDQLVIYYKDDDSETYP